MSVPRLSVLLASGLLALAPAAPALAQSAGDEQYSDPLGGQTGDGGSTQSSPGLTDAPQDVEGDSGTAAPAPAPAPAGDAAAAGDAAPTSTPAAQGAPAELARTGADAWLVGLVGVVLVLFGIGLRLRTADARP